MYKIIINHSPREEDNAIIREGIISFNEKMTGIDRDKPLSIFLKDNNGDTIGGLQAWHDPDTCWIDVLWIKDDARHQGCGSELLKAIEAECKRLDCRFIRVNTWSFQAEAFYLKNGYEREAEIKNHWLSYSKIFLKKKLKFE